MKAPKIQRIGKKIPKKNIHPCPFLSVISPSVNATSRPCARRGPQDLRRPHTAVRAPGSRAGRDRHARSRACPRPRGTAHSDRHGSCDPCGSAHERLGLATLCLAAVRGPGLGRHRVGDRARYRRRSRRVRGRPSRTVDDTPGLDATLRAHNIAALAVGRLAIAFNQSTDQPVNAVLFSGQDAFASLVKDAPTLSLSTLSLLLVFKGLAWSVSLGNFRGGPTFPALFLGAVGGLLAAHLPGFSETLAVAVLMGCWMRVDPEAPAVIGRDRPAPHVESRDRGRSTHHRRSHRRLHHHRSALGASRPGSPEHLAARQSSCRDRGRPLIAGKASRSSVSNSNGLIASSADDRHQSASRRGPLTVDMCDPRCCRGTPSRAAVSL
jgi:hypothetical protein